jgi:hypothetical protein
MDARACRVDAILVSQLSHCPLDVSLCGRSAAAVDLKGNASLRLSFLRARNIREPVKLQVRAFNQQGDMISCTNSQTFWLCRRR